MEKTIAFNVMRLYRDFFSYSTGRIKELGLNYGQLKFVLFVGKFPECTQAELTNRLEVDWGYSQRSIAKLVDEGFILKHLNEGDGRAYHLSLTEKGDDAFRASHEVFQAWDEENTGTLSTDERDMLVSILKKLNRSEGKNETE